MPITSLQILLNDLDISSSHMERLVKDLKHSSSIEQHFLESEMEQVHDQLESLLKLNPTFRAMLKVSLTSSQPYYC